LIRNAPTYSLLRAAFILFLTGCFVFVGRTLQQDCVAGSDSALSTGLLLFGFVGFAVSIVIECWRWARGKPFLRR
jgi:Na+-driven multidrug efflux pump